MTAKLVAHRRQKFIREVGLTARTETLIKRHSQHRSRNSLIDPGLDRPSSFARIRDSTAKLRHLRILQQRSRGQVQQPRSNDTPTPPNFSHIRQIEVILVVFRIAQRRRLSINLGGMLANIGSLQYSESLSVSRHHPILDTVMDHLDEVATAIGPAV